MKPRLRTEIHLILTERLPLRESVAHRTRNFPPAYVGSLQLLKLSTTEPNSDPVESTSHRSTLFFKDRDGK